ncbi:MULTISPECIES: hypothetical protein [unclassified Neochlamydia]|uniref:hypothetical protein n=1 Tax=unclassified Neochlamydia TaxID=2643326 RepID=UPI00140E3482|nr:MULTISPECIES: hypothetical protein [unclassified Neochlamydia]MBS4165308.1 Uncharacterized protein [Neochlamydia sp. AcF65]MBS4169752.1 Uncharacterized protein [Neochlamydia sp. AcF95]NGY94927.1 hypothetical protein [Neochlamydia sp. AcF84]
MGLIDQIQFYSTRLINGDCLDNFRFNNTAEIRDILIAKIASVALIAGIVTAFFTITWAPIVFIGAGVAAFAYYTAEGLEPPSKEYVTNVIERMRTACENV